MRRKRTGKAAKLTDDDLREALKELKTYVDVTEQDLLKIYELALRHAQKRIRTAIPVSELMSRDVVRVKKDASIDDAARRLSGLRISGMPVVDDDGKVIGVISEADILSLAGMKRGHTFRDILRHLLGEPLPKRKQGATVGDVMSTPPITALPDDDVRDVAAILDNRRIKRLPVVDEDGKLIGIISRADIVRAIGRDAEEGAPGAEREGKP